MKVCTKCNKKWQDEFNICPMCGSELVSEEKKTSSISLGDANAVSGGIHHSNDHSIKNDNSVSASNNTTNSNNTTTTNTTTTTNVYHGSVTRIEREKSQEELLKERKLKFRECCKKVLEDGLLTSEERIWLEEQRVLLDLSAEMASHILNEVSNSHQRTVMSMGTVQRIQFSNFKHAVEGNMVQNVKRLMPPIKVIASKFQEEELQFVYHMALAALSPQECVDAYTNRKEDKYWLTFWTYVALHKLGDIINAESVMIDLGKWQGLMPDENLVVLGALGALIEGDKETASELYMQAVSGEHSPLLTNMTEVIVALLNYDTVNTDIATTLSRNKFYVENFLKSMYEQEVQTKRMLEEKARLEAEAKRKAEEDRKRKEAEEKARLEAEAKRKAEEDRKRKEAEEKARLEAEAKRKAEEDRKRKEAEEKRLAEAEAKRQAEEEKRRIAEEKRRIEEERKQLEEERKRIAKEEQQKKEQARKEEEQRRLEEEKRKRDEELKRKEKEERERVEMNRRATEAAKTLANVYLMDERPYLRLGDRGKALAGTIDGLTYLRTPEILFMHAVCFEQGYYGIVDKDRLAQLYLDAAQAGEPLGYVCLVYLHSTGEHGFAVDEYKAFAHYLKCVNTNRKKQALTTMGIAYMEKFNNVEKAKPLLQEAAQMGSEEAKKYLTEITKKTEKIEKKQETPKTRFCPQCGKEISVEASFCRYCGRKLSPSNPAPTPKTEVSRVCPKCGNSIRVGAAFCNKCGTKITEQNVSPQKDDIEDAPDMDVHQRIIDSQYISNLRIGRSWVLPQMIDMCYNGNFFNDYKYYQAVDSLDYEKSWRILLRNYRVISIYQYNSNYSEYRYRWWTKAVAVSMARNDLKFLKSYISEVSRNPRTNCSGGPYIRINLRGCSDKQEQMFFIGEINPDSRWYGRGKNIQDLYTAFEKRIRTIENSNSVKAIYESLKDYNDHRCIFTGWSITPSLPVEFKNAYIGDGAFTSMMNFVKYLNLCYYADSGEKLSREQCIADIEKKATEFNHDGKKMFSYLAIKYFKIREGGVFRLDSYRQKNKK